MSRVHARWGSPPLLVQILALLIGALLVAQMVTLVLTLVLPPEPPHRYEVSDIATALRGGGSGRPLDRRIAAGPPDLGARGWLISATATAGLARAIGVPVDRVVLGFYTDLPVEGAVGAPGPPPGPAPLPSDARPVASRAAPVRVSPFAPPIVIARPMLALVAPVAIADGQADRSPMPSSGPNRSPPTGFPPLGSSIGQGAGFPGAGPAGGGFPPGGRRGGGSAARTGGTMGDGPRVGPGQLDLRMLSRDPTGRLPNTDSQRPAGSSQQPAVQVGDGAAQVSRDRISDAAAGAQQGLAGDRAGEMARRTGATQQGLAGDRVSDATRAPASGAGPVGRPFAAGLLPPARLRLPSPIGTAMGDLPRQRAIAAAPGRPRSPVPLVTGAADARIAPSVPAGGSAEAASTASSRPPVTSTVAAAPRVPAAGANARPVPITRGGSGLFGLAPPPFVEGDFVAALHLPDGRWAVVTPAAEGFPSAWQRRVLLWFALSLLAVAPVAWAFARRIVGPLRGFADAAERLGRDPAAAILPLDGPAEVGRAAHAFNQMQSRLRSFVDDRTAMIGAISHDLRTPLTRLRFRIEEVPDEQHAGLLGEIEEMEAMISSVIAFMRDASTPGARERRDLAELVGDVIEDAALIGDVRATKVEPAPVDIDALGMRRVLDNLLTNAIKYGGGRARVALHVENALAVADIVDDGPGIAEAELERVFEPFYRSQSARDSEREGSGLGLAVCRSIARAHGGDVRLFRSQQGFTARVILPLAYDGERQMAA